MKVPSLSVQFLSLCILLVTSAATVLSTPVTVSIHKTAVKQDVQAIKIWPVDPFQEAKMTHKWKKKELKRQKMHWEQQKKIWKQEKKFHISLEK